MYCQLYEYENPIRKWKHTPFDPPLLLSGKRISLPLPPTHSPSQVTEDVTWFSFQRAKKQNAPAAASGLSNYIFVPDEKGPPM